MTKIDKNDHFSPKNRSQTGREVWDTQTNWDGSKEKLIHCTIFKNIPFFSKTQKYDLKSIRSQNYKKVQNFDIKND